MKKFDFFALLAILGASLLMAIIGIVVSFICILM